MNASAPRRLVAIATTLASAAVLLVVPSTLASASTPAPAKVTYTKATLNPSTDLANPMRGLYRWMGYDTAPANWPAQDVYYRDQTYWGRLERTKGVYDFSTIDSGLAAAGATHGKFGFRVMAFCPGCWMEARTDKVAFPPVTPSFLPKQAGTNTPDWNSEAFLSSWESLMAALGKRYANDKRLGYVDVGGYGKFGEWWVDKGTPRITPANGLRMVKAVTKAFPAKHVLLNTMTDIDFTVSALAANPNLGIRTDSLGCPGMYSMVTDSVDTRLQSVWKTRPFLSEWGTTGDPVAGKSQVKAYHVSTSSNHSMRLTLDTMTPTQLAAYKDAIRATGYRYSVTAVTVGALRRGTRIPITVTINNTGVAPTYDPWRVYVRLTDSTGHRAWTSTQAIDLRKQLPGKRTYTTYVTVPTTLKRATYAISIGANDPAAYSPELHLANWSRRADGSYTLGSAVVG